MHDWAGMLKRGIAYECAYKHVHAFHVYTQAWWKGHLARTYLSLIGKETAVSHACMHTHMHACMLACLHACMHTRMHTVDAEAEVEKS